MLFSHPWCLNACSERWISVFLKDANGDSARQLTVVVRSKGIPGLVATGNDCSSYAQDASPTTRMGLATALPRAVRGFLPLDKSEGYFGTTTWLFKLSMPVFQVVRYVAERTP